MSEADDVIRLCPTCGGASVDFSALVGGQATCRSCAWGGSAEELLLVPIQHLYGTREGAGFALVNEYRRLYNDRGFVQSVVSFLTKWGFVSATRDGDKINVNRTHALRYLSAIARAGLVAIVEEREKIEREEKTPHAGDTAQSP